MPDVPVKILSRTHPDYNRPCLERWEALYEGGKEWREHIDYWIPKNPQEPAELWAARKERAAYINDTAPVVDLIVAWCFASPPSVDGLPQQGHGSGWATDVDGQGRTFAGYARDLLTSALVNRTGWAWCNLPATDAVFESRADQERAGALDAYLVDLDAEDVIHWGEDARGRLSWVMIADTLWRQDGPLADRRKVHRWTLIDAERIRRWEWLPTKGKEYPDPEVDVAAEVLDQTHGWKVDGAPAIPVVRLRLPSGLHVLGKIEDVVTDLVRAHNDLGWALHRGAHELMVLQLAEEASPPTLGAGYYLKIGAADKVSYAAPSGVVYASLTERITDLREQVYRSVQQMAQSVSSDSTPSRASGASKALDWQALAVMIDAYGELLKVALRRILALVAEPLVGPGSALEVSGLDGWSQDDLMEILANAATSRPMVPSSTFKREQAKRIARMALPDLDEATRRAIDTELDEANFEDPAMYEAPPPVTPEPDPAATPPKAGRRRTQRAAA